MSYTSGAQMNFQQGQQQTLSPPPPPPPQSVPQQHYQQQQRQQQPTQDVSANKGYSYGNDPSYHPPYHAQDTAMSMTYSGDFSGLHGQQPTQGYKQQQQNQQQQNQQQQQQYYSNRPPSHTQQQPPLSQPISPPPPVPQNTQSVPLSQQYRQNQQQYPSSQGNYGGYPSESNYQNPMPLLPPPPPHLPPPPPPPSQLSLNVSHSHSHSHAHPYASSPPQAATAHVTTSHHPAAGAYSGAPHPHPLHHAATVPPTSQLRSQQQPQPQPQHQNQQQYASPPTSYHQHHASPPPPPESYADPAFAYQAPAHPYKHHNHNHHHHHSAPPISGPAPGSGTFSSVQQQQHYQQSQYPQSQTAYQSPPPQNDGYSLSPPQSQQQRQQEQHLPPPPIRQSFSHGAYPQNSSNNYRLDTVLPGVQSYNQQQQQQQPPPVHRQQQSNYLGPETGTGTENPYQSPPISPPAGPPLSGHQYPNPTIPPPSGPSPLSLSSALGNYGTQQQQQQQTQYLPKSQSPLGQYHRQSPMTQSPINQSPMNRYQTPPPQPLSQAQTQMQRHQSLRVTSANANDPMHGVLPGLRPVLSARADSRNGYTERRQSFGHTPISAVLSSSESPAIAQTLAGSGGMADGPKPQFRAGDGALPTGGVQGGIPPAPGTNSAAAAASASHGVVRHDSSSGYHSNAYGAHNRESFHTSPGGRQQGATTMSSLVSSMGALSVGAGGGLSHHLSPPPPPPPPPRSATAAYAPAGALAAASSLSIPSQQFHASQATLLSQSAVQLQPPPMQPLSHIGSTYSGAGGLGGLGSHSTLVGSAAAAAAVPGGGSGGGGLVASNKIQQQLAAMHSSVPGAMNQQQQNNASLTFAQAGENMAYPLWNNISATSFQAYRHQIPVPQSNLSGTKYALIIGINYYNESYSQTSNINGAHTLKTVLVSRYGYKERNVVLLSDDQTDSRNHPTHHTITTHIKRMMHGLQPNDSVFFYYCGFGRLPIQLAEDHTEALSSIRRLREDLILPCDFEQHGAISSTYLQKHLVCGLPQSTRLTAIFNCIANDTVLGVPYKYVHSNGCAVLTSAIAGNNLFEAEMKLGNASLTTGSFGDLSQRFETSLMQQQQQQQALVMGSGNRTDQTASDMDRIRQLSGDIIVFGWDRSYADPRCKNYMAQTPSTMLSTYWMTAMDTIHRSKGQVTFGDLLGSLQNSSKDIVMMPFIASGRKLSMDEVFNM